MGYAAEIRDDNLKINEFLFRLRRYRTSSLPTFLQLGPDPRWL
jgi:hypothetical protein